MAATLAGVRHGVATAGLVLLFAGGALRQAVLLQTGVASDPTPLAATAEVAVLCAALGGLIALRSLRRTTRERDRVEDLHWDSMEAVRSLAELGTRPGADLSAALGSLLDLGVERFRLELGVAWRERAGPDGEILAARGSDESGSARVAELLPQLREAARAARPSLVPGDGRRALLTAPFTADGERGVVAFEGLRARRDRFTATDKDLLGLIAVWVAREVERHARMEAPAAVAATAAAPRRRTPRPRDRDLNTAVRQAERGLRRLVGADATLELALAEDLPPVGAPRLPLAALVNSLVLAAARLAPAGRIRVETAPGAAAGAGSHTRPGDVTLSACVTGDVDGAAFDRLFEEPDPADAGSHAALSIPRLERLLRREGADLSIAVEPGRRALLTAYLPAVAVGVREQSDAAVVRADQPSR